MCPVNQAIIPLIHWCELGVGVAANGSHDRVKGGPIPNKSFILQDASVKSAKKAGKEDAGLSGGLKMHYWYFGCRLDEPNINRSTKSLIQVMSYICRQCRDGDILCRWETRSIPSPKSKLAPHLDRTGSKDTSTCSTISDLFVQSTKRFDQGAQKRSLSMIAF
jgi:hypothetical protein